MSQSYLNMFNKNLIVLLAIYYLGFCVGLYFGEAGWCRNDVLWVPGVTLYYGKTPVIHFYSL